MTTSIYVPGTGETDPKKIIMSLQQVAGAAATSVQSVAAGAGISVGGTATAPIITNSYIVRGDNLLPNCNAQLWSRVRGTTGSNTAMNSQGTALQTAISISSFSVSSEQPTFLSSNTQQIQNGSLLTFGAGLSGLSGYALRVINLVPNVSFACQIPFGNVSPASSSAITGWIVGLSNHGNGFGPDGGWSCSASLTIWADDFAANIAPGAIRSVGFRKGSAATENYLWNAPSEQVAKFRGRTVTLGLLVWQKVQGGAGTAQLIIGDNTGNTFSSSIAGSAYSDPTFGGFQFITVTRAFDKNATAIQMGVSFTGANSDIYYICLPTAKLGSGMVVDDLGPPPHEVIVANTHWNPDCLVPFTQNFPTTGISGVAGLGLFGWAGLDIEALSFGQCHNSVAKVNCKIEFQSATVSVGCFVAALEGDLIPSVGLVFGPQAGCQVANITFPTNMGWLPLRKGPSSMGSPLGCFALFSGASGGLVDQITFDFDDVMA